MSSIEPSNKHSQKIGLYAIDRFEGGMTSYMSITNRMHMMHGLISCSKASTALPKVGKWNVALEWKFNTFLAVSDESMLGYVVTSHRHKCPLSTVMQSECDL